MDHISLSMKSLSNDLGLSLISKSIDAMATGKKTTVGYRTIVLVMIGALMGNMLDLKGSLVPLAKLPDLIPLVEEHTIQLKELRKLREDDHRAIEDVHRSIEQIREILRRNKIGDKGPEKTDISTAQYEE